VIGRAGAGSRTAFSQAPDQLPLNPPGRRRFSTRTRHGPEPGRPVFPDRSAASRVRGFASNRLTRDIRRRLSLTLVHSAALSSASACLCELSGSAIGFAVLSPPSGPKRPSSGLSRGRLRPKRVASTRLGRRTTAALDVPDDLTRGLDPVCAPSISRPSESPTRRTPHTELIGVARLARAILRSPDSLGDSYPFADTTTESLAFLGRFTTGGTILDRGRRRGSGLRRRRRDAANDRDHPVLRPIPHHLDYMTTLCDSAVV